MMSSVTSLSAQTTGRNSTSNKRHKSGAHHRAKTAKKKKKQWAQFSRWGPDAESDNDDEFVQFCQSRGLTRATTAPPFRNNQVTTNLISKDVRNKRYATAYPAPTKTTRLGAQETVKPVATRQTTTIVDDSVYISRLCSSLKDKRKFVLESQHCVVRNDSPKETTENENNTKNIKIKTSAPALSKIVKIPTHTPEPDSIETKNNGIDNKKTSLLPDIVNSESPASQSTSPASYQSIGNFSSIIRSSNDVHKHLSQRRPTKEWNAEVENEIMRLYESGGPGSGLMDSKPLPRALVHVKEQMETKISNADHTPSYVLALANLFRRRMQIRKEFSQVAGEMMTSSLKTAPVVYASSNAFPKHNPRNGPMLKLETQPTVSLRYHHVTPDIETSSTQTTMTTASPNISFCSISTPIIATSAHAMNQTSIEGDKKEAELSLEINTKSNKNSVENMIKEKLDNQPKFTLLLPFEAGNKSKTEALDNLLTVFPKPPQFKYASLNTGPDSIIESTKEANNKMMSIINSKPQVGANEPNNTVPSSSLVASFTKSIKRNTKHNLPHRNSLPKNQFNNTEKIDIRIQPTSKRKCRSANLSLISEDDFASTENVTHFKPSKLSKPRLLRDVILLNKHPTSQTDDVNMSLLPMSKVRWTGSLGTLYKKTNPDLGRTILDSIAPELDNLTNGLNENTVHRKVTRPQVNPNPVQTDLMAVSPG